MASVFRVNRNHEMNGNQIMYWGLQVGGGVFRSADPPSTGRWTFGEPTTSAFRFSLCFPCFFNLFKKEMSSWSTIKSFELRNNGFLC